MHPNTIFHTKTAAENLKFAQERGFGVLSVNGPAAPLISHIPFVVDEGRVWLHLLRSNPIARAVKTPCAAVLAVSGPDSYVSPDWYSIDDQVPTWNYIAVHLRGTLHRRPDDELRGVLDRLSERFENALAPKPTWRAAKMTPEILDRMMRAILPYVVEIDDVQGTWKMNQNKPDDVRLRAAQAIAEDGIGHETRALAYLMRNL